MTDSARSLTDPVVDKIVHSFVWLPRPPSDVFRYFTEVPLLESWLTVRAQVDPRVDGKYELFWEPSDPDNNSTIGCRITAFQQPHLLSFQWRSPKQFKVFTNGADPLTHVTVALIPQSGGTMLHLVHSGWRSSSEWEEARIWQERAWKMALDALVQLAGKQ